MLASLRRAHGIRGEVLAASLGSEPDRFRPGLRVILVPSLQSSIERTAVLERCRGHQNLLMLKFAGVETRNEAEELQGWFVCVPEEERPPLEDGQVYLSDLVGCEVFTVDDRRLGEVTGWQDIGGPVLLELGEDLLIPYVPQICREVDLAAKRIRVDLPEGLEDLNRK